MSLPFFFFFSFHFMMEKYKFDCFFLSFRLNSSPLNFYLRLVLQPALLPMMCHISTLNKPPHVAGANLFRNLNPHRRNILPVTARKWRRCRSCNSDQLLGTFLFSCIIQTCASGEASAQTLHGCTATAASHGKLQLPCQCQVHPPPPFQEALSCEEIHCTIQKSFSSDHPKH